MVSNGMGASATLRSAALSVEAGGSAACELTVRNAGRVVDEFSFEVRGDAASWIAVEPPRLSLFPGAEETVQVRFQPPRSSHTSAGETPFAVIVVSKEDPEAKSVEEGTIEVAPFFDAFAELVPRTSHGRFASKHQLAIDNRGNAKMHAQLEAYDLDELLRLKVEPIEIVADPGTATIATVRVRPKKRFLRGEPKTKPFQVVVTPEGAPPLTLDGTYLQEGIIPRALPKLLAALAVIAAGLAIAWFTLLHPTIKSESTKAAKKELGPLAGQVGDLDKRLKVVEGQPPGRDGLPTPQPVAGTSFDRRLEVTAPAGGTRSASYAVPAEQRLLITDLLLQNPNGDSGLLTILRNGAPLLEERLENFRDLDYHFVTPLRFTANQRIEIRVECETGGQQQASPCNPAIYFTGTLERA